MFKHVQTKLIFLITLTILVFMAVLVSVHTFERKRSRLLYQDINRETQNTFDKTLSLKGEALRNFVFDYTFFDEMVSFAHTGDRKWAHENLDTALSTFKTNTVWVYNASFSLVYEADITKTSAPSELPVPREALREMFRKSHFVHFFADSPQGLMEIQGATIHPTSDYERKKPAQGYFFAGRLWTKGYMDELSHLTGCSISVVRTSERPDPGARRYSITFRRELLGWDGRPLMLLNISSSRPVISVLNNLSNIQFVFFVFFALSILSLFSFFLMKWVTVPLKTITESIDKESPHLLSQVSKDTTELGHLARLVTRFIEQRAKLLGEIEERRKTEAALRESEERYHTLFDNAYDMIQSISADGRFIFVNPAWLQTLGYSWDEVKDMTIFDVVHPDHRARCADIFSGVFSNEATKDISTSFISRDGRRIDVEGSMSVTASDGRVVATQCIFRNVTERRKSEGEKRALEEQLRQSQKMEAVGQLAGGIAHDFNNILNAMMGFGSLLEIKLGDNETARQYVNRILTLAENAANLTKSLLAFSRKQVITPEPTDIKSVIESFGKLILRIIGEDVQLKIMPEGGPLGAMVDRSQIEQVLMNLATNARDAMPTGGILSISAHAVDIDPEFIRRHGFGREGRFVRISVSDTGIGMDDRTKSRIFEPFFTTKEVGKGTGLGLAMVYGIVSQHNGYVDVVSEPGRGTTFNLYMPWVELPSAERINPVCAFPQGRHENILFAEDNSEVRQGTRAILEENGYCVIEAEDGEDLIKEFVRNKDVVDLVLTDVIMPKKSGREAYDEIVRMKPGTKFIFMSGYAGDHARIRGLIDQGLNFLEKPVSPKVLLESIRTVLDQAKGQTS